MKKKCIYLNCILLFWFFLDMVGVYFDEVYLVSRAWKEDGIFFIIYLITFFLFVFYDKLGKFLLSTWLGIWLVAQLFSHEYFTIVGGGEGKVKYFEGSIKLFESENRYYPDLYHIILHILLVFAFICMLMYVFSKDNEKQKSNIK